MKKIIAVLNDFKTADDVLEKALELSFKQRAMLEILYVHEEPLFDIPDYFRSDESIKNNLLDKDKIKKEIENRVSKIKKDHDFAVLVYINDTADRLATLIKEDSDVFVITAYHEKITKKLLKKSHFPVLVIKNSTKEYKKIVIPVDLSENSLPCISFAQTLFEKDKMQLLYDYRYIIDVSLIDADYLGISTSAPIMDTQINQQREEDDKKTFEDLKNKTGLKGDFIEESLSVEEDLSQFINVNHSDLTILCSDEEDSLFSKSISFTLLGVLMTDILIYKHHTK